MDDLPPVLLERHPELVAVGEALEQFGSGASVTARCLECGVTLEVVEVAEVGVLVVSCPAGHVSFRARRSKAESR